MKNSLVLATPLLFALLFGSSGAEAQVAPVDRYPGTQCQFAATIPNVFGGGANRGIIQHYYGTVANVSSTDPLFVMCPVDQSQRVNLGFINGATIKVYDRNPTTNVTCVMESEQATPTSLNILASASQSSTLPGPNEQPLTFTGYSSNNADYTYVACSIPPASGGGFSHIISLMITE